MVIKTCKNTVQTSFDSKISSYQYVVYIRNKALMRLGVLKSICKDFNDK